MTPARRAAGRASRSGLALLLGAAGLAGAAALVLAIALPHEARAFVRYKTDAGLPFEWKQTCIPVTFYPESMKDAAGNMDMTPDEIAHAVTASAATWSAAANTCSFLIINTASSTDPAPAAGYDKKNSLIFQKTNWCGPRNAEGGCTYDAAALAITSVFVVPSTGVIKDADIEINAYGFTWADLDLVSDPTTKLTLQDLQNAVTHEMGHLIGLDHTCHLETDTTPRAIDNAGNPVPDCNTASATVRATTMFASANPGDTEKRTLAPDDALAVCEIYPVAMDPMYCPTAEEEAASGSSGGCRCDVAGGGRASALPGLALGAMVLARRRRRAPTS